MAGFDVKSIRQLS